MAYDFNPAPFQAFDAAMQDYPEGLPDNPDDLARLSALYLAAAQALFALMLAIMRARMKGSRRAHRFDGFLPIYEGLAQALLAELEAFFAGDGEAGRAALRDFLEGVRQQGLAQEMAALGAAVETSSGDGADADADEAAGHVVTNSLKEQIERRVRRKFIKDILHGINEVLAVARGVV
ncbi:MAG: hypothetical protein ACU0AT_01750 [Tranquillimonas sp.]